MKTAKENLLDTLKDKRILFLENDTALYDELENIELFLKEHKLKYKCLFDLTSKRWSTIKKAIDAADVIIFQTQWVYPISKAVHTYIAKELLTKKAIIECYLTNPTWYYIPLSLAGHDVYIIRPFEEWRFYKLSEDPYWDYKNKFDK